jgi:ankyrin repeat protein
MISFFDKQEKDRPLHDAANIGHTEIVKMLLRAGAEIDAINQVSLRHHSNVQMESLSAFR